MHACRCHPEIAAIANAHFYGSRLLDGCGAAARAPLLPGLPPLLALDTRGQAEYSGGSHSASNRAEARVVVKARAFPSSFETIVCLSSHTLHSSLLPSWQWI